jgi:hypothetical protein
MTRHAAAIDLCQPRHFILQLQLAALEFRQNGIVHGRVLEGVGKLVVEPPMLLYEFGKMGRWSHGIPPAASFTA